jgi:HAD superfamily hydrolase (TIGR01459 family)
MISCKINSFNELSDQYSLFVFDLWGVVYNGVELYTQTVKFIDHLRSLKKHIIFLSNAPRPSSITGEKLAKLGLKILDSEKLITSGDFFRFCYQNNIDKMFGPDKKIYNLGGDFNTDLLKGLDINYPSDISNANYIILSILARNESEFTHWDKEMLQAISNNIPALCINPDMIASHGDSINYTPGTFAKRYKDLGGRVYYYGKPYLPLYHYALDSFIKETGINKNKIIAIGDSLETDIKGATSYGIDSLLLLNGVHAGTDINSNIILENLFKKFELEPKFLMAKPKFE